MDELIKEVISYIKARWHRKSTLLILILFSSLVLLWIFSGIDFQAITIEKVGIGLIILLTIGGIWIFTNLTPRASKGKIGFAVGIRTDGEEQYVKIKRDFIEALRALLYNSKYRYSFHFIEVPDRILEKIHSPSDASKVLHSLECAFMIYGKARTVNLNGQLQHFINLEGVVAHKPVASEISKSFSKEFADLLPRKLMFSSEGDLFHFEFTASLVNVVSKYIIGVAALLSGDVAYAQELFESLNAYLKENKSNLPVIVKLKDRLPSRLRDVYLIRSTILYESWKKTKRIEYIEKMTPYLDAMDLIFPDNPEARVFRSMWHFIIARDVAKAKNVCVRGKNKQDIAWRYNYAFLFAYEGNLERASKEYKQAFKGYFSEPSFIFDIVDWILWVLNQEPDKTQLYFCLGLIYYYAVGDYSLAFEEFGKFLELSDLSLYAAQRNEAGILLKEIQKNVG